MENALPDLTTEVSAFLGQYSDQFTSILAVVVPVALLIVGGPKILQLAKRFISRV